MWINSKDLDYNNYINSAQKKYLAFSRRWKIELKNWNNDPIMFNWKPIVITKMDFKDMSWFSDEELLEIIKYDLWVDLKINHEDWLDKINELFFKANQIYEESRVKKIFERKNIKAFWNEFWFDKIDELLNFMKTAWLNELWWKAKLQCYMMKICSSVNDIINTPCVNNLDEEKKILIEKLEPILDLHNVWEDMIWRVGNKKFILYWRPKSHKSMVYKNLINNEYSRIEDILDSIWFTFELIDWNDIEYIKLLQIIQNAHISIWRKEEEITSKVKWINIDKLKNKIHWNHSIISLLDWLDTTVKWWTSQWYIDVKTTVKHWWISVENKIVPHKNKNQDWLNFQWVYSYLEKELKWILTRHVWPGFITNEEINILTIDFFENLQEMINANLEKAWVSEWKYLIELWDDLKKWEFIKRKRIKFENRSDDENIKKYMIEWLENYFKSKLIKIELDTWDIVYTTEERSEFLKKQSQD